MAGIAGIFGEQTKIETIKEMLHTIKHRGPDSIEIYQRGKLAAGTVASNLSDARGNATASEDGIAVFFDGEIYNKRNKGTSDAEVVLDLYQQHGRIFPAYLEGVFACAVSDGNEVLLARDAVGVRPLYWGKTADGAMCFASEMKALVGVAVDIWELRPATTYVSNPGIAGYIPRYPEIVMPDSPQKAAQQLREYLFRAVRRRLEDGAVGGLLLSGGLDSSIIAAIANELKPGMPAFTVGVKGAPDLKNAEIMAKHLGLEHHIYNFDLEAIIELVPTAVRSLESFDEDCISGAIANLFASSLASKFTNCILSGEGGDELFGGYHLLKELPTEDDRLKMMGRLIDVAYNTALQRLDRAMMANSINYRTPFIDTKVIAFALQLPVQWKVHDNGAGKLIEKWLLREAFKDMLPAEIYSREKLRFSGGTGTDNLMDKAAEDKLADGEFNGKSLYTAGAYRLNTPKEFWYYRLFKENFPLLAFEELVGRWDPNK
jgi:asparagine synthase (glutamine-hydrolysing)